MLNTKPSLCLQGSVQELLNKKDDLKVQENVCKQLGK